MKIEILSSREFGEPKLSKPKELKGIKQAGTALFGPKCKCPFYLTPSHVYVKHRDFFSPSISFPDALRLGIIDNFNKKFVYNDNFGSVVLRSEAWLKIPLHLFHNSPFLLPHFTLVFALEESLNLPPDYLGASDWPRFFQNLQNQILNP